MRLPFAIALISGVLLDGLSVFAQSTGSVAGVENTKLGTYRALAEVTYEAFQRSDYPIAAKLARILERTWDHCESVQEKSSPAMYEVIDDAMDAFIKPLIRYSAGKPDPASVENAYKDYVGKLANADQ